MAIYRFEDIYKDELYPPRTERERFVWNDIFTGLYEGNMNRAFADMKDKLTEEFLLQGRVVEVFKPIILEFGRLIPKKYSELMFGIQPTVYHSHDNSKDKDIRKVLFDTDFYKHLQIAFTDAYMYGNGIMRTYNTDELLLSRETGKATNDSKPLICNEINSYWVPVVSINNNQHLIGNILSTVYKTDVNENEYEIELRYFTKGQCRIVVHKCSQPDSLGVVTLLEKVSDRTVLTDKDVDAISNISNFSTAHDGVYGKSSYLSFFNILEALIDRYSQIDKVLDKHVMPTLIGPSSLLQEDKTTGQRFFKRGSYIGLRVEEGNLKPQYLEWDGKLDSAFKEVDELTGLLYQMAETGTAFLDANVEKVGFAESARAMRIRYSSPISFCNLFISQNKTTILRAVANLCRLSGVEIDPYDLEFTWHVNLPEDELEKSQIFATKIGSGFSIVEELKRSYGMSEEGAKAEFEAFLAEKKRIEENKQQQNTLDEVAKLGKKVYNVDEVRNSNDQLVEKNVTENIKDKE